MNVKRKSYSGKVAVTLTVMLAASCSHTCLERAQALDTISFFFDNGSTVFDKVRVTNLLENIEIGNNAALLREKYFDTSNPKKFPITEGLQLLKAVVAGEKAGSKKWFFLQSLYCYELLKPPVNRVYDGLQAYDAFFSQAAKNKLDGARSIIRQASEDMPYALSINDTALTEAESEIASRVLKAAFKISASSTQLADRVRWRDSVKRLKQPKALAFDVDKILKKPNTPSNFYKLWLASAIYEGADPLQAVKVLQEIKISAPNEYQLYRADVYDALVKNLTLSNDLKGAILLQEERVKATGEGVAKLVLLQVKAKNEQATQTLLNALKQPTAKEAEINLTANLLLTAYDENDNTKITGKKLGEELLVSYLSSSRSRAVEQELRARLRLSRYYVDVKRVQEAKRVLDISHLAFPPEGSHGRLLYAAAQRRLRSLDKVQK